MGTKNNPSTFDYLGPEVGELVDRALARLRPWRGSCEGAGGVRLRGQARRVGEEARQEAHPHGSLPGRPVDGRDHPSWAIRYRSVDASEWTWLATPPFESKTAAEAYARRLQTHNEQAVIRGRAPARIYEATEV